MRFWIALMLAVIAPHGTGHAEPGVGDPVYGATLNKGVTEFEARYGRLTGGPENGTDGLVLEAEHAFSNRLAAAVLLELNREFDGRRELSAVSAEAIYALGSIRPLAIDVALYGEYKFGLRSEADVVEGKLLLEHRAGPFDARLNLIFEHAIKANQPIELGYAVSADWRVVGDDFRLGFAAFGDLGTSERFGGRQEHFAGPDIKTEIEHVGPGELEIEAGWLRAFGAARDHTAGQARLLLSYEVHF